MNWAVSILIEPKTEVSSIWLFDNLSLAEAKLIQKRYMDAVGAGDPIFWIEYKASAVTFRTKDVVVSKMFKRETE